jgi:hypothetical protein
MILNCATGQVEVMVRPVVIGCASHLDDHLIDTRVVRSGSVDMWILE